MNRQKVLNLLGMAYRAKKVINGYESVMDAVTKGRVNIVFVANDASEKTIEAFNKKCFFYHIEVNYSFSTEELSKAIGKGLVKILAINDNGFANSLKNLLSEV